jgi:NAD(P)-dependent dehydrogenase (short-subunit alcohol dehydrogenase family)
MAKQLEGKITLVTGGGSGIGRASALFLAREGAKIIVADIEVENGEETADLIKKAGGHGDYIKLDVSQSDEVEALISKIVKTYGQLDCAHNNAGILGAMDSVVDCSEEEWNRVLSINLTGVWLCMKYEIEQMLKQKGGAIVNTASVAGLVGAAQTPAYSASKHGVVGLTKSAALTYAPTGIRINAVCPAFIITPLLDPMIGAGSQVESNLIARHPIGRMGKPEEVAEAVVWLCSDAASFVTGHSMAVDGGYVAQ